MDDFCKSGITLLAAFQLLHFTFSFIRLRRYFMDRAANHMTMDNALLLYIVLPFSYAIIAHPDPANMFATNCEKHKFGVYYGRTVCMLYVRHCMMMLLGCSWAADDRPRRPRVSTGAAACSS